MPRWLRSLQIKQLVRQPRPPHERRQRVFMPSSRATAETPQAPATDTNPWTEVYGEGPRRGLDFGDPLLRDIYQRPLQW
jgi:hypothetical protein